MGSIRSFLDQHFLHFNARETVAAARAYENHIQAGGKMLVTLAGAMSTAKLGQILARMIRADMVHGICCTGANLEEDLFNLLAYNDYKIIEDYRALSVAGREGAVRSRLQPGHRHGDPGDGDAEPRAEADRPLEGRRRRG